MKATFRGKKFHSQEEPLNHPEGSSSDSDICGIYQRFLTSIYNGAYGDCLVSQRSSDYRFMGRLGTEIAMNNYGQHMNDANYGETFEICAGIAKM